MKPVRFIAALSPLITLFPHSAQADAFLDVTAVDLAAETVSGNLSGVAFTLVSTRAVSRPVGDNGGVIESVVNGAVNTFSSPTTFTPPLPSGDYIVVGATSDFRITFAQPVSNVTLHISQLEANRLSFTTGGVPVAFSLLSSDGDFTISSGSTAIEGAPGAGDDASGSLLFAGTLTELSWTSTFGNGVTTNTPNDGYTLQASVIPEPTGCLLLLPVATCLLQRRFRGQGHGFFTSDETTKGLGQD